MDMCNGYWQTALTESSRAKTAFFILDENKCWNVMPMGATNAQPTFVAMAVALKIEWTKLVVGLDKINPSLFDSKVIIDDILLAE